MTKRSSLGKSKYFCFMLRYNWGPCTFPQVRIKIEQFSDAFTIRRQFLRCFRCKECGCNPETKNSKS